MKFVRYLILAIAIVSILLITRFYFFQKKSIEPQEVLSTHSSIEVTAMSVKTENITETASVSAAAPKNPEVIAKLQILSEIFKSKNDNDPRMDKDLKNLSQSVKEALKKQYLESKMELRNERGTIAFLIGRECKEGRGTVDDVEFLKNVLLEKPCLSLLDCSKSAVGGSSAEEHLECINETTADYPQLINLRYLKQSLEEGKLNPEMRAAVIAALQSALHSSNPRVAQEAQAILDSNNKN